MILTITYNQLVDFGVVAFIIAGVLIVWAAVVNVNELSKRVGEPTLKEWWLNLWRNRHNS